MKPVSVIKKGQKTDLDITKIEKAFNTMPDETPVMVEFIDNNVSIVIGEKPNPHRGYKHKKRNVVVHCTSERDGFSITSTNKNFNQQIEEMTATGKTLNYFRSCLQPFM